MTIPTTVSIDDATLRIGETTSIARNSMTRLYRLAL
jgi:hypothetical protein